MATTTTTHRRHHRQHHYPLRRELRRTTDMLIEQLHIIGYTMIATFVGTTILWLYVWQHFGH
jgi:hypothetical protein